MAEYMNNMPDAALDWDSEVTNEQREFVLLPAGDYLFTVQSFERARYEGSAKLPPCRLYLHTKTQGLLGAFFESIGQCKRGETFRPRWNEIVGAQGMCRLGVREYTKQSGPHAGETGQANEIEKFLPRPEPTAAPSTGWKQGAF